MNKHNNDEDKWKMRFAAVGYLLLLTWVLVVYLLLTTDGWQRHF